MRIALVVIAAAAQLAAQIVPLEPAREYGNSVTPAYEGWFPNADGTFSILFGYYNRNVKQELDIPVGADNRIEPAGPDRGQPTHFNTGRNWGVFTVTVPRDFGKNKITWTLTANGVTTSIPAGLDALWEVAPFKDANGNTPPSIGFSEKGPFIQGPKAQTSTQTGANSQPINLWVADDASVIPGAVRPRTPAVTLAWSKYRGPGTVTFSNARPPVEGAPFTSGPNTTFQGKATTNAIFSEPGEYILHVVANDYSGDGGRGFQCCWSNAQIKVTVKPTK